MKIKTKILTFALLLASMACVAQTTIPVYKIMHSIETNVLAEFPGHAEWGMTHLRQNIHSMMKATETEKLSLPAPGEENLSPENLYNKRLNGALIFGKMYSCGECPKMHISLIATATAISEDGVCLTNYHVVHPIVSGDPKLCAGDSVYFLADRDGQCYPITEIMAYSRDEDIAAIRVDTRGSKLEAIPLGTPAATGQHINLISHPKQMLYIYTQGYVSRNTVYAYPNRPVLDLMEITADFAEGSSGGPIMDDKGNLVGMVKGTTSIFYDAEKRNPQMVLKVTIPVKRLRALLRRPSPVLPVRE